MNISKNWWSVEFGHGLDKDYLFAQIWRFYGWFVS